MYVYVLYSTSKYSRYIYIMVSGESRWHLAAKGPLYQYDAGVPEMF